VTTYTESDLATETLKSAGIVEIDGVLTASEFVDVTRSNGSVVQMLGKIGLPIWNGSEIDVPEEYFIELALRCSLPIQFKNGMIDHAGMLSLIEASETRLVVMAAPRGAMPLLASSNESTGGRPFYNWQTGL
jgi:hypothetical protein